MSGAGSDGAWGAVEAYRRSFGALCAGVHDLLLDALPDGRVLDVGCGPGGLLGRALDRGWDVAGVDPSPAMVACAARVAPGRVEVGGLPRLAVASGSQNGVVANFVVNHLGHPADGVREMARVLAPGGRVAMTVWPAGGAGWGELVGEAFSAAGAREVAPERLPEEVDFPRTPQGLAGLCREAGLTVREARTVEWEWAVAPADLWAGVEAGIAGPGRRFLAQDQATRVRVREAWGVLATGQAEGGPLRFRNEAVLVVGERE